MTGRSPDSCQSLLNIEEIAMTDIALARAPEATAPAPLLTRRVHALFRLLRLRVRKEATIGALGFADDRVLADIGLRRDRHRDDWLTAVLGR
jgi:hypothetical protein